MAGSCVVGSTHSWVVAILHLWQPSRLACSLHPSAGDSMFARTASQSSGAEHEVHVIRHTVELSWISKTSVCDKCAQLAAG